MKMLEHILESGTQAEKELVQLAESMPTKAEEKLKNEITGSLVSTLCFGAGAVLSGYMLTGGEAFSLFWGGLGVVTTGIGTLVNGSFLKDYLKVQSEYNKKEVWDTIIPLSEKVLFYQFNEGFTYNPTPIEVRLGQRVYLIEGLDEIEEMKERAMVYVSQVVVREVSRENYDNFIEKSMTDRKGEFEKIMGAKVQYELRKGEEANCVEMDILLDNKGSHYFDAFSQTAKECSLLLSMEKGKIKSISRMFPYQRGD